MFFWKSECEDSSGPDLTQGSGNVARDVGGSPFAAAFVEHLAKCRTLRDLREAIHEAMNVATGGRQARVPIISWQRSRGGGGGGGG